MAPLFSVSISLLELLVLIIEPFVSFAQTAPIRIPVSSDVGFEYLKLES